MNLVIDFGYSQALVNPNNNNLKFFNYNQSSIALTILNDFFHLTSIKVVFHLPDGRPGRQVLEEIKLRLTHQDLKQNKAVCGKLKIGWQY